MSWHYLKPTCYQSALCLPLLLLVSLVIQRWCGVRLCVCIWGRVELVLSQYLGCLDLPPKEFEEEEEEEEGHNEVCRNMI